MVTLPFDQLSSRRRRRRRRRIISPNDDWQHEGDVNPKGL